MAKRQLLNHKLFKTVVTCVLIPLLMSDKQEALPWIVNVQIATNVVMITEQHHN